MQMERVDPSPVWCLLIVESERVSGFIGATGVAS